MLRPKGNKPSSSAKSPEDAPVPILCETLHPLPDGVVLAGHRGNQRSPCGHIGENTLASIRKGWRTGLVEIDVQVTKDDKLVVLHDDTLRRTALGVIDDNVVDHWEHRIDTKVADLVYDEISCVCVGRSEDGVAAEAPPLLSEVLRALAGQPLPAGLLIEIKSYTEAAMVAIKEDLNQLPKHLRPHIWFISFDAEALRVCQRELPGEKVVQIFEGKDLATASQWRTVIDQIKQNGFDGIDGEADFLTTDLMAYAKQMGLKVVSWPSSSPASDGWDTLIRLTKDGLLDIFTTNYPSSLFESKH